MTYGLLEGLACGQYHVPQHVNYMRVGMEGIRKPDQEVTTTFPLHRRGGTHGEMAFRWYLKPRQPGGDGSDGVRWKKWRQTGRDKVGHGGRGKWGVSGQAEAYGIRWEEGAEVSSLE